MTAISWRLVTMFEAFRELDGVPRWQTDYVDPESLGISSMKQ
jgi:hypothetical protein